MGEFFKLLKGGNKPSLVAAFAVINELEISINAIIRHKVFFIFTTPL